jgi:hypothetical protein
VGPWGLHGCPVTPGAGLAAGAAAVEDDTAAVERAARRAGPLDPDRLRIVISGREGQGSQVTVQLTYDSPVRLPLVGALMGPVRLHAEASMRVER